MQAHYLFRETVMLVLCTSHTACKEAMPDKASCIEVAAKRTRTKVRLVDHPEDQDDRSVPRQGVNTDAPMSVRPTRRIRQTIEGLGLQLADIGEGFGRVPQPGAKRRSAHLAELFEKEGSGTRCMGAG